MSQGEILNWLKEQKGEKFSARQIVFRLEGKLNTNTIYVNLRKLADSKDIKKEWDRNDITWVYYVATPQFGGENGNENKI